MWETRSLGFGTCSLSRPYREGCLLLNGKGMWGGGGTDFSGRPARTPLDTVTHHWGQRLRSWVLRHHDSELRAALCAPPGSGQALQRPTLLLPHL